MNINKLPHPCQLLIKSDWLILVHLTTFSFSRSSVSITVANILFQSSGVCYVPPQFFILEQLNVSVFSIFTYIWNNDECDVQRMETEWQQAAPSHVVQAFPTETRTCPLTAHGPDSQSHPDKQLTQQWGTEQYAKEGNSLEILVRNFLIYKTPSYFLDLLIRPDMRPLCKPTYVI